MPKTMPGRSGVILSVALLALFLFSGISEAAGRTVLILVKGEPKVMKKGSSVWDKCIVGMDVGGGDRIKTLKNEAVEISFSGRGAKVIKIEEDSDVFVRKITAPYSIELLNGSAMAFLEKLPRGSSFEIRTPAGVSGARGTGWGVSVDKVKAVFKAFENFIYVQGIDASGNPIPGELMVRSGWQTIVDMFTKPEKLEDLASGDIEKWNAWKKDLLERLEKLKEQGFEEAGEMQNRIQELEEKKNTDVRDARDFDNINNRQDSSSSGGYQDDYYR